MADTKSAIGSQQVGNVTHSVMGEQLITQLQNAVKTNPGSEFLIVQRTRQGEDPTIWSTGDTEQTKDLFRGAYTSLAYDKDFERT